MSAPVLEYKTVAFAETTAPAAETSQGVVEALVAVTGVKDDVGDIIVPGAFARTLRERPRPKVCLGHDWNRPIGKTLDIKELMPGDPRLPKETADGKPWPREAGAVWAQFLVNMAVDDGRNAFHSAKFYGPAESTYSIGYRTAKAKQGRDARRIMDLDLYEYGPVLNPANRLATLQAIKSAGEAGLTSRVNSVNHDLMETKARYVRDAAFWGLPLGTLIRPGMKPQGPKARKRQAAGKPVRDDIGVVEIDPSDAKPDKVGRMVGGLRIKPTARRDAKRDDGTWERDLVDLFPLYKTDVVRDNVDPFDSDHFTVEDGKVAIDGNSFTVNNGEDYNPLDMVLANAVTPAELEENLREEGAREIREEDQERWDAYVADVIDAYREKYNAELVRQNSPTAKRGRRAARSDRATEVDELSLDAEGVAGDDMGDRKVRAELTRIVAGLNSDRPDWDDDKTAAEVDKIVKQDVAGRTRILEALSDQASTRAAGEPEPESEEDEEPTAGRGAVAGVADKVAALSKPDDVRAAIADLSDEDIDALDAELADRAAQLGKRGHLSKAHAAVIDARNERADAARDAGRARELSEATDEELRARLDKENAREFRSDTQHGRAGERGREIAVREITAELDRRRGAVMPTRPQHPLSPKEYAARRDRVFENQFDASDVARRIEIAEAQNARIDLSEQIAAEAPESIETLPPGAIPVADGRLALTNAGKASWSLNIATGETLVNASMFADPAAPNRAVKLNRAQAASLAEAVAAITDSNGNRIPTTALTADWAPGFRDAEGRDGYNAIAHAVAQWADANGFTVDERTRMRADSTSRPGRMPPPGVADADGFYPSEPDKHVAIGDDVRLRDGTIHTVAEKRTVKRPGDQDTRTVFVFTDGTEYASYTGGTFAGVRFNGYNRYTDPDRYNYPGMGWSAARIGGIPEQYSREGRRAIASAIPDPVPAGTRLTYTPEDRGYTTEADSRTRVGTVSPRFDSAGGNWFQVVEWDDGTDDALNVRKLAKDGHVVLDPTPEQEADARRQWGLPVEESTEDVPDDGNRIELAPATDITDLGSLSDADLDARLTVANARDASLREAKVPANSAARSDAKTAIRMIEDEKRRRAAATPSEREVVVTETAAPEVGAATLPGDTIAGLAFFASPDDRDKASAVLTILDPRTSRADRASAIGQLDPEEDRDILRRMAAGWAGAPINTRARFDKAAAQDGIDRVESGDPTHPLNAVGQIAKVSGHSKAAGEVRNADGTVNWDNWSWTGKITSVVPGFYGKGADRKPIYVVYVTDPVTGGWENLPQTLLVPAHDARVEPGGPAEVSEVTPDAPEVESGETPEPTAPVVDATARLDELLRMWPPATRLLGERQLSEINRMSPSEREALKAEVETRLSVIYAQPGSQMTGAERLTVLSDELNRTVGARLVDEFVAARRNDWIRERAAETSDTELADARAANDEQVDLLTRRARSSERSRLVKHQRVARLLSEEADRRGVGTSEPEPVDLDAAVPAGTVITAEELDEVAAARDEALGLEETPDGELEVTAEVAARQDRVEAMIRADDAGTLDLAARATDDLVTDRVDLQAELRLQNEVARRDAAAKQRATQADSQATQTEGAPKVRPGLAGAAQDHAEALESGDTAAITRTRRRLDSAVRRSRADSDAARALAEGIRSGADATTLANLTQDLRTENRERRNAAARKRRTVKRLERERIKSLIGKIDAELRGRGQSGDETIAGQLPESEVSSSAPLSDEEYEERTRLIESILSREIKAGRTTDRLHTVNGDGQTWTRERAEIHKRLMDALWEAAGSVPRDQRAVIAGGLGGAGKSTVLRKFAGISTGDYYTINPDDVKEEMSRQGLIPRIEGLSPMEASALVHEESSHIANMLARRAYAEGVNVMWDITMSRRSSVEKRIAELRDNGYGEVDAVFVDIPVETSVQRALSRHRRGLEKFRSGTGQGGRYVPPALIRANSSDTSSSANRDVFDQLVGDFDSWVVYDNSVQGRDPQRIDGSGTWASGAA